MNCERCKRQDYRLCDKCREAMERLTSVARLDLARAEFVVPLTDALAVLRGRRP